jgi:hypothetical protein
MKRSIPVLLLVMLFFACPVHATGGNPEEKSAIEKVVTWYMDNMNYGTVALLMTVESSCLLFLRQPTKPVRMTMI